MINRIEKIVVNGQEIRVVDGLLLVIGNHGAGKTAFLQSVLNSSSLPNYQRISILLNDKDGITNLLNKAFGNSWDNNYRNFVRSQFKPADAEALLKKVPYASMLLSLKVNSLFAYRRLLLLHILLAIKDPSLIVIDEPELAVHPIMIREMCVVLTKLQEKGHVLIVATNSENVVSRLFEDIEQVVRLEKNEPYVQANAHVLEQEINKFYYQNGDLLKKFSDKKQTDTGLENIITKYSRIYLTSILRNTIFWCMHAEGIILGEGSSEDIFFDYIDQILHPSWMREYRIHYMGCLGKSTMPLYFLFLNHMGIKTVCLFDKDKESNVVHQAYFQAFQAYEKKNGHCFAKMVLDPDLEHVLNIVPPYKLLSMEKPVNIFQHTFTTNNVEEKAWELAGLIKAMFEHMK